MYTSYFILKENIMSEQEIIEIQESLEKFHNLLDKQEQIFLNKIKKLSYYVENSIDISCEISIECTQDLIDDLRKLSIFYEYFMKRGKATKELIDDIKKWIEAINETINERVNPSIFTKIKDKLF